MKILVCDYSNALEADYSLTENSIKKIIPDARIAVMPYTDEEELVKALQGVDGLITGFLEIGEEILKNAPDLKCISVSGVGYAGIDLEAAAKHDVAVCHIAEYCTGEVAEHTMALICSLNRHFKYYAARIEQEHEWKYHTISAEPNLASQCLAIIGFGRIGRQVASLARAFGMTVIAVDPYAREETLAELGVERVDFAEALKRADIITNHMNLTKENYHMFDWNAFSAMERKPLFINVGRGGCVCEEDLIRALDAGLIRGAGLDVLEEENPVLEGNPLLHRDNVIITPHSAFYSAQSVEKLQTISADNMAYYLSGQREKVFEEVKWKSL